MFQCKACQAKLVNPVRVNCLECKDVTLCVTCFSNGEEVGEHKNYHKYQVLEQFSFPLFTEDWAADEEELLIEGLKTHGMGNWEDVSGFVRTKSKEECEKHYVEVYYNSDNWPLPKVENNNLKFNIDEESMRERKRRRYETTDIPKSSSAKTLRSQKPMQSLPSNHEICGYMPLRKEFEMEYENDAELYIKDLEITDKDSKLDFELKVSMLGIYDKKLEKRADRKRLILEHDLINYKNNKTFEEENYKTKEEKELANKIKPFTQLLCKRDYTTFRDDLIEEDRIKEKILKKIEYRKMGIKTHSDSSRYEKQILQKQINRELAAQPHSTNIPFSDRLTARSASKGPSVRHNEHSPIKKTPSKSSKKSSPFKSKKKYSIK